MKRNFLPSFVGIAMTKSQFCFSTGLSPYHLKKTIKQHLAKYERIGYHERDKMLMPAVVRELCADTGLQIDIDFYAQYVSGQRGNNSPIERE